VETENLPHVETDRIHYIAKALHHPGLIQMYAPVMTLGRNSLGNVCGGKSSGVVVGIDHPLGVAEVIWASMPPFPKYEKVDISELYLDLRSRAGFHMAQDYLRTRGVEPADTDRTLMNQLRDLSPNWGSRTEPSP